MTETTIETQTPDPTTTEYTIDPTHSTIGFVARHLMVAKVRGHFKDVEGEITFDPNEPGRARVRATIPAASITTGVDDRDAHLRSADFFDVENHPTLTFQSTRIETNGDDEATLVGELTIRGVTREVALDVERMGATIDPWGNTRQVFTARTKLDRSDFGLTWNQALETGGVLVGNQIVIELDIQAVANVGEA